MGLSPSDLKKREVIFMDIADNSSGEKVPANEVRFSSVVQVLERHGIPLREEKLRSPQARLLQGDSQAHVLLQVGRRSVRSV